MPGLWIQRWWRTILWKPSTSVDKLLVGVVSLSVFGGNFVLVKVRLGLISVHCSELRGVRFSEVRSSINRGQVICPLYRGCLLFGRSVIRGFSVLFTLLDAVQKLHLPVPYTVKTLGLLEPYFGHLSCMLPVVCVTHYKTSRGSYHSCSQSECSWEASPFVKAVSPYGSISDEVGVSLILHICPWRSALVAWLW